MAAGNFATLWLPTLKCCRRLCGAATDCSKALAALHNLCSRLVVAIAAAVTTAAVATAAARAAAAAVTTAAAAATRVVASTTATRVVASATAAAIALLWGALWVGAIRACDIHSPGPAVIASLDHKLHRLAVSEGSEAVCDDAGLVHKHIVGAVAGRDETKALGCVEPLHSACDL